MSASKMPQFGPDGLPIPNKPVEAAQLPDFASADGKFWGMDVRTADHPLIPDASIVDEFQYDDEDKTLERTIKLFSVGFPLALVGESGAGKTLLIKYLCAGARIPLYQRQGHNQMEWEDLVGRWVLEDDTSVFVPGPLVLAMQDDACFLLDEAASVKQGILNGLNELANGGDLVIDNDKGHKVVKRSKNFRIAISFNPWDNYAGNNELNIAFLTRFFSARDGLPEPEGRDGAAQAHVPDRGAGHHQTAREIREREPHAEAQEPRCDPLRRQHPLAQERLSDDLLHRRDAV